MINKIKRIYEQLNQSIFVGEKLQSNIRTLGYVGLAITFCTSITTTMNLMQGSYFMALTTAVFAAIGIFSFVTCFFYKKRKPAVYSILLACVVLMTYYAVSAQNEGFAILWTLIVPLAVMFLGGVKLGIVLSLYYWCLFIVLFYTPLRMLVAGQYTVTFMRRFPVLYLCAILINSAAMIRYHISVRNDMEYNEKLTNEVNRLTAIEIQRRKQMESMSLQMIETLASAIDAKDKYTNGHSYRVSEYAVCLARKLGWTEDRVNVLRYEALLHDVGKIGMPDTVLNKDSKLTDTEYKIIQFHTFLGGEILSGANTIPGAEKVARYHHERVDGKGYPEGLKGNNIPENARVVCIADSFDAMNSDRVYRKALSRDAIIKELIMGRGTQFDAEYLDVFLKMYEAGELGAESNRFSQIEGTNHSIPTEDIRRIIEQYDRNYAYSEAMEIDYANMRKTNEYIKNLYKKFKVECSLVVVKINVRDSTNLPGDNLEKAIQAMSVAMKQTVPNLDALVRCSKTQIMMLVPEDKSSIDRIMQRVYVDFYKLIDGFAFDITYEIVSEY